MDGDALLPMAPARYPGAMSQHPSPRWVLLALAVGAFGIGTTEFSPMGLLPVIADGVDVSIPTAGLLVSAYAVGVMVGAPFMTLLFARFGRRAALISLMLIFTVGNLLSACAPGYWTLMAARVVTSLNHGAFFGLGSVVAASVVPRDKQASAVATMFMGLTVANIGGVPAATWLGQQVGWRMAFAGTAGLGLLAIAALRFALPRGERGQTPRVREELRVLTRAPVLLAMATTVMGSAALFGVYTYVAPLQRALSGSSDGFITATLVLIGVGFSFGNWFGGKLADGSVDRATMGALGASAAVCLVLPFTLATPFGAGASLLVWGATAFAMVPPVQTRVMRAAADAPVLASSINVGAFNLGNAIGAAVGGGVIHAGWGYGAVPLASGLMAAIAALLVLAPARPALAPCEGAA